MQIFEFDINAICLALQATAIEEEDILSPQISVTEDPEFCGGTDKVALKGVEVLKIDRSRKKKETCQYIIVLYLGNLNYTSFLSEASGKKVP